MSPFFFKKGLPIKVPIEDLCPPLITWRCRQRDEQHVKTLYKSIKENPSASIFAEPTTAIIFDPETARKVTTITETELLAIVKEKKGFVFHGDHRREAVSRLHKVSFKIFLL